MTNCETVIVTITTTDSPGDSSIHHIPITGTITSTTDPRLQGAEIILPNVILPRNDETSTAVTGATRISPKPEKPFQCDICERRFRQLSTLANHVKIHTGEKPYKCNMCDKAFRQSSTLTNHMKIHTGEKPFNCTFCGKQFRQLSTLTNHLKIHTGEKPFECAVCKKQFRQSSTLNNHIKIHVMDKLYLSTFDIKDEVMGEEL